MRALFALILLAGCQTGPLDPETGNALGSRERACIAAQTALAGVATLTKDDDRRIRVEALWLPLSRAYCA